MGSCTLFCVVFLVLYLYISGLCGHVANCEKVSEWRASTMEKVAGHYPGNLCVVSNVVLNLTDGTFYYKSLENQHSLKCNLSAQVWTMQNSPEINDVDCKQIYDVGYVYTIYFYRGRSNYFHLHWDMLLPLYQDVFFWSNDPKKIAFMPSVETQRLQTINWDTPAFDDFNQYWVQLSKLLAKGHAFMPLTRYLRNVGGDMCFKEIRFGTAKYDHSQASLVKGYAKYIKSRFNIEHSSLETDRIGIISRSNRRRILNEWELVNAAKELADTQLVILDELTFHQQVELMQKFTVLIGMNGAGLINCIYLPANGACVQLVPYDCNKRLNFKEYGKLLAARGPYLEWHNTHQHLHRPPYSGDSAQADTYVHMEEFVKLVKTALNMARTYRIDLSRDEL